MVIQSPDQLVVGEEYKFTAAGDDYEGTFLSMHICPVERNLLYVVFNLKPVLNVINTDVECPWLAIEEIAPIDPIGNVAH